MADATQGSRKRGVRFKLLVALISLVTFFGLAEVVARLAQDPAPPPPETLQFVGDPDFHFKAQPNWKGDHDHRVAGPDGVKVSHLVPAHTNRYGQRCPDYAPEKPPGEFRVAGIGDSLMFGPGVPDGKIFMHLLQSAYDGMELEVGRVRVINAAFNGYHVPEYGMWAETQLRVFEPDVFVVAVFTGNDHLVNPTNELVQVTPWRRFRDESALARWLDKLHRRWLYRKKRKELDEYAGKVAADMDDELTRKRWDVAIERLADVRRISEENGAELVVLLLPTKPWADAPADDAGYGALREKIESKGIRVIDALPYLRFVGDEAWLPYDVGHLDVKGHEAVARALITGLREMGLVH